MRAVGLLAISIVVWGCSPRVTAVAGPYTDPLTLTTLRSVLTALVMVAAIPILRYRLPHNRAVWWWTAASGLLMVTVFLGGFTEAIIRAGPGIASVLSSTPPFWVALIGWLFLGQRVAPRVVGGLLVGFAGVVLMASSQLGAESNAGDTAIGMAFAVGAALGWAIGTMLVKELIVRHPDTDLIGLTTGQYVIGGGVLLVLALPLEGTSGTDWGSGEFWLAVAFIAIVGSAIATVAYFGALRWLSATTTTAWLFLSPVVTVLLEIALGHTPKPLVLAGMAVTIAGVAIVNSAGAPAPQPQPGEPQAEGAPSTTG